VFEQSDFKKAIMRSRIRILRPNEYQKLLNGCRKTDYRTILQALLYTGMRYIEMQRLQKNPSWFDGEFIHLPQEATRKVKRTQKERWVRLNQSGRMIIEYFIQCKTPLPSWQSWSVNLKRWGERVGLDPNGLSAKTTRKTWESWLMFYYPNQIANITLSQGHTQITSLQYYVNMPFNERDKLEMRKYVEGWI
jgi:integrase